MIASPHSMTRRQTILQSEYPYNVGARSINKEWFSIPMPRVWEIMEEQLYFIHHAFSVRIHAFMLMSNHFHLIVSTPDSNLSEAMCWFMRETSRALTRAGNRINQSYGGRYFRSLILQPNYYLSAYKYLYYNPVHAGICQNVLQYPFSTLPGLLGMKRLFIPVLDDTLFDDVEGTLGWLNRAPDPRDWEAVGKASHRKAFSFPRENSRRHHLETDTL
jgi:putative transposase